SRAGLRVLSATADGADVRVISSSRASGPDGIAVDSSNRRLFWTTMGAVAVNDGTIETADLDGSHATTVVQMGGTFTPKQIKIDAVHHKLYWSDREGMRIMRANLDGSRIETLVETGQGEAEQSDARRSGVGTALAAPRR